MAAKNKDNVCPECGLPPSTSENGPDGSTVYACATGHQWTASS